MKTYKEKGIIYKIKKYLEKDKLLWVLSQNHGKLSIIAKGVRNPKSKRGGHIDLFNFASFSLYKGQNFDNLTEIQVINSFSHIKQKKPYIFFYLAELLDKVELENTEGKNVLLLLNKILNKANVENIEKIISFFEINLLEILGYKPNLKTYIGSDKNLIEKKLFPSIESPGYTQESENTLSTDPNVIKCQRIFQQGTIDAVLALKVEEKIQKTINQIQKYWIQAIIGKNLKSIELLNNI